MPPDAFRARGALFLRDDEIKDEMTCIPPDFSGLHVFADGCHEPRSGQGGWSFVVYRDAAEIASDFGGVRRTANNAMELFATLRAVEWINANALGETAVIWTDSLYVVNGCNIQRPIWRTNGWRKRLPNGKGRSRAVENSAVWQSLDLALSGNGNVIFRWCKGHSGIHGNEHADRLAEKGRLSLSRLSGSSFVLVDANPISNGSG